MNKDATDKSDILVCSFHLLKVPGALGTGSGAAPVGVQVVGRDRGQMSRSNKPHRAPVKSKDWIVKKKEQRVKQGKEVKSDSKFTGRKRHAGF